MTEDLKAENERLRKDIGTFRAWARSCQNAKEQAVKRAGQLEKSLAEKDAELGRLEAEIAGLKSSEWYKMAERYKTKIVRPR